MIGPAYVKLARFVFADREDQPGQLLVTRIDLKVGDLVANVPARPCFAADAVWMPSVRTYGALSASFVA